MNTAIPEAGFLNHPVVSSERWIAERKTLLAREKELTRLRDQIARERRALPWERHHDRYEPAPVAKPVPATGSCCHSDVMHAASADDLSA